MAIHHAPPVVRDHRATQTVVRNVHTERPAVRTERPVVRTERRDDRTERRDDRGERRDDRGERRERYVSPVVVRPVVERRWERPLIQRSVYVQPAAYWNASASYTVAPQAIQLLAPTSLASDQLSIETGGSLGAATSLELDAAGGSTFVSQVVLVDAYGGTQSLPVNEMLSPQNPTIQLPLASGSSIVRVIIDGHSDWGGQLAMRAL